jgi:hypothetical protein
MSRKSRAPPGACGHREGPVDDAIFDERASNTEPRDRRQASAGASPQEVYDGRCFVGTIIRRDQTFEAVDRHGRSLGLFSEQIIAMRALAGELPP